MKAGVADVVCLPPDSVVQHIPFDYDKKAVFGVKVTAYLVTGFAIPFVAAYYQLYVARVSSGFELVE